MSESILPRPELFDEALALSREILDDIELTRLPLGRIALKTARLARLLGDVESERCFHYEANGYPTTPKGVAPEVWKLVVRSGRVVTGKPSPTNKAGETGRLESIEVIEAGIDAAKLALAASNDPDVSIASANPSQHVWNPIGNKNERAALQSEIQRATQRVAVSRAFVHRYVSQRYYELRLSSIVRDVFGKVREDVDAALRDLVPGEIERLVSVHANLRSETPEDWANAVHSCRRFLQAVADAVFPPRDAPRIKKEGSESKLIQLGREHYINRLVCFVEDRESSETFAGVVGSHLRFLGDRLDALFNSTQKGSHATVSRREAERYAAYGYLLIGDILSLVGEKRLAE